MDLKKTFDRAHGRLDELREEARGHEDALKQAEGRVASAKHTADEARIAAVVDPAAAPAAARAERDLETALEARDRLVARGHDLTAAIQRLEADLHVAAGAVRTQALGAAGENLRSQLLEAKPTIEATFRCAATLWALDRRGPLTVADLGPALATFIGADLDALRRAGLDDYERLARDANAPLRTLATGAFAAAERR